MHDTHEEPIRRATPAGWRSISRLHRAFTCCSNLRLLQSDGHPGRAEGYLQTKLYSKQVKDDAVRILKPCYLCAAADRKPRGHRAIVPAMSATVRIL
jgi:hypothetical protein